MKWLLPILAILSFLAVPGYAGSLSQAVGLTARLCVLSMALAPADAQARGGRDAFYYEYTVEEGDTLYLVARKYSVSMKSLQKANPRAVRTNGSLRVGKTLKIRSSVPIRVRRKAWYVVKKGDALKRIARRLGVSLAELRKLNSISGDRLKPDRRLVYLTDAPESVSESVGACNSGKLINGEKLPVGPGYSYGSRPNVYGANETITLIIEGIARFVKKYPGGPVIVVGNLSRPVGGKLKPHKSHQSGRDVDIGYVHKEKFQPVTHMLTATEENLDLEKTWFLIESFLNTGKVTKIFIDYYIQEMIYKYLVSRKYKKAYLDKVFQYPKGKGSKAVIQHSKGHHHHMHVRFDCPGKDSRCTP